MRKGICGWLFAGLADPTSSSPGFQARLKSRPETRRLAGGISWSRRQLTMDSLNHCSPPTILTFKGDSGKGYFVYSVFLCTRRHMCWHWPHHQGRATAPPSGVESVAANCMKQIHKLDWSTAIKHKCTLMLAQSTGGGGVWKREQKNLFSCFDY